MGPQFLKLVETLVAALLFGQGDHPNSGSQENSHQVTNRGPHHGASGRLQVPIPGVNRRCYESMPPAYSLPDNRLEFFNLFTAQPPKPPSSAPTPYNPEEEVYRCWDKEYENQIDDITEKVGRRAMFASFRPEHQEAVFQLRQIIEENISAREPKKLMAFLRYLRNHRTDIHPQLFLSALATAIEISEHEVAQYDTPALPEMFPTKFFTNIYGDFAYGPNMLRQDPQKCTRVNERWGWENGIENRLWYFREDIQLNMHHWSWHLRHPTRTSQPMNRRGELFSFFHHDFMARYAAERLVNGFSKYLVDPIIPVENLEIPVGYNSNLRDGVSTNYWVNRPNNTVLNDTTIPPRLRAALAEHKTWWDQLDRVTRINGTFHGYTGDAILIPDGINTFGETLEASNWTANQYIYGNIGWHNMAHNLLASVLVENGQSDQVSGVLGDTATAVRDVSFFRIHNAVNEMFMRFKHRLLKPYQLTSGDHPLVLPGVQAKSISVQSLSSNLGTNKLETHWENRNMVIDGGLDFDNTNQSEYMQLRVCAKHLDNKPFQYNIQLENTETIPKDVYIRIFMAPRSHTNGVRFKASEQIQLYFAMDAFPYTLQPGSNIITRLSDNSSVTTGWWIPQADLRPSPNSPPSSVGRDCPCGWPKHLLLPKGTETGMEFDLVYIVTDGSDFTPPSPKLSCTKAYVHCGIKGGAPYPDSKPMGYPFDRLANPDIVSESEYIDKLISSVPNMGQTTLKIFHNDQIPREHLE